MSVGVRDGSGCPPSPPPSRQHVFLDRIPKEEMHFQPLEDIAENLEESGGRHPNMALFNRLLNAAPSPSELMGGALRRTSAQVQRLRHSPSIDPCTSEDEDQDESCKLAKGGSLPLGLGQDTQSTVCSFREEKSNKTPLLDIQFRVEKSEEEGQEKENGKAESTAESTQVMSRLPPPPPPPPKASPQPLSRFTITPRHPSASPFHPAAHSSLEHCSSQPVINQNKAAPTVLSGNKMSFLAVPSLSEPQRLRSVSMGSELTGS